MNISDKSIRIADYLALYYTQDDGYYLKMKGFSYMSRIIALIIMVIPGVISAYGIKLMRDMVFGILQAPIPNLWLQFILGFIFFAAGLAFIAGFILYRDRKKNKVQAIFRIPDSSKKQNRP